MKLAKDSCHVWRIEWRGTPLGSSLDAAERERADRFHHESDRNQFVACREALRSILSAYLDREPRELVFRRGKHGRPELAEGESSLAFNISHSKTLGLVAVAHEQPLGVDIEELRDVLNAQRLAQRFLTPDEQKAIESADDHRRSAAFLTCWTRKEAVLKSIGTGLTRSTREFQVGAGTDRALLKLPHFPALKVFSFEPARNYIAACATSPCIERLEFRSFEAPTKSREP